MTYREHLDYINADKNFYLYKAVSACEVNYEIEACGLKVNDEQFETICNFVYEWISNTEASATEIASVVVRGLKYEEITFNDFDDYTEDECQSKVEIYVNDQF